MRQSGRAQRRRHRGGRGRAVIETMEVHDAGSARLKQRRPVRWRVPRGGQRSIDSDADVRLPWQGLFDENRG
jgi:hypothetical protein